MDGELSFASLGVVEHAELVDLADVVKGLVGIVFVKASTSVSAD
jgi:hypothetical protein